MKTRILHHENRRRMFLLLLAVLMLSLAPMAFAQNAFNWGPGLQALSQTSRELSGMGGVTTPHELPPPCPRPGPMGPTLPR